MLNLDELTNQIKDAWKNTVPPALEQCVKELIGQEGELQNEAAKNFAETFDELTSESISELIATAIDYYVKNIAIDGMIMINPGQVITVGSPFTQTQSVPVIINIRAQKMPTMNGKVPNTLGIS